MRELITYGLIGTAIYLGYRFLNPSVVAKPQSPFKPVPAPPVSSLNRQTTQWLQNALNFLNYAGLKVDGIFGPKTKAALIQYQKQTYGLNPTGYLDQQTRQALEMDLSNAA